MLERNYIKDHKLHYLLRKEVPFQIKRNSTTLSTYLPTYLPTYLLFLEPFLGTWNEMVITHCVVVERLLIWKKTKEEEQSLTVIEAVLRIHNHGSQKIEDSIFKYRYITMVLNLLIFKTFKQLAIKPLVFIVSSCMRIVGSNYGL